MREHFHDARQPFTGHERGLRGQRRGFGFGNFEQAQIALGDLEDEQVAQMLEQVTEELAQILPVLRQLVEFPEHGRDVALEQAVRQRQQLPLRREAEHREHIRLHDLLPAKTDELVERRLRVAHAAVRAARDGLERRFLDGHVLLARDQAQVIHHQFDRDAAQVEALAAGENRRQHLLRVGGGEHELHMRGRLLQRLEQRVEGRRREHVNFVDDVDLELPPGRRVLAGLAQFPHLLHAVVARAVDLHHVERAALGDFPAARIVFVVFHLGTARAVQALGEDAGDGRLARAARAAEEVGMGDAPGRDGMAERVRDVLLPDHVGETLRAILARDDLVRHLGFKIDEVRWTNALNRAKRRAKISNRKS